MNEKTNKLSIYLLKKEFTEIKNILKDFNSLKVEKIGDFGDLYYGDSHTYPPDWINNFFKGYFKNEDLTESGKRLKIFSASSKAIFITKVDEHLFAVAFGYGRNLLIPGVWEERFGLRTVLNILDPANLRSIDKKNMSFIPKISREQITKSGDISDFGIDIEQDLIRGVTGKSQIKDFGETVTGKDALSVSVKKDLTNLKDFLKLCSERFESNDYKKNFDWIDNISEIKSPKTIVELNSEFLENIKKNNLDNIWMSIPDVVNWEDVKEFKIKRKKISLGDDIYLTTYLNSPDTKDSLSLNLLKEDIIECVGLSSENIIDQWKAFDCFYVEIRKTEHMYMLSNGKWYEIENSFSKKVIGDFEKLRDSSITINLPAPLKNEHEDKYNERVGKEIKDLYNMDRKLVSHGGGKSKIEFCDLLTKDKKMIHVKYYGGSAVLSHLFSQGAVSGELFLNDEEFRKKVIEYLPDDFKYLIPDKPDSREYTVFYLILSNSDHKLEMPFFSKVSLRIAKKRLETFGYKVFLQKLKIE